MSFRFILWCAVFGSTLLLVAFEGMPGQGDHQRVDAAAGDERAFLTDFLTLHDCIERVAREGGLGIELNGIGSSWDAPRWKTMRMEPIDVVVDQQKFPFLTGDRTSFVSRLGRRSNAKLLDLPIVKLDLDTGELTGPENVDLRDVRILRVRVHLVLTRRRDNSVYKIDLSRSYPGKEIRVSIASTRKDQQAFFCDFLNELELKVKLATILREARKKREANQTGKQGRD